MGHHQIRQHLNRQALDQVAPLTSIAGVTGAPITVGTEAATATSLAFDESVTPNAGQNTAPPLATNTPIVIKPTTQDTQTAVLPSSTTATTQANVNSTNSISLSTVIGSCVGAFIGATALILLGLWFYRRYSKSLKKMAQREPAGSRNAMGEHERSRSRAEPWSKLDEGDDRWEGMDQTKEVDTLGPMEKLTMFKHSPSVRTAYTQKSDEPEAMAFDLGAHPFAQYSPNLAQELASDNSVAMPAPRPFLGHIDAGSATSWDADTTGSSSFLSIRSSPGSMSPTRGKAIPTPPPTSSRMHRWESAEIIHYSESESAHVVDGNPFEQHADRRTQSRADSFFTAPDPHGESRPSTSPTSTTPAKSNKGKERALPVDPFGDDNASVISPPFADHNANESVSSVSSNDRALQSLIAALDVSEQEVQDRRVASMQPSFVSESLTYPYGEDNISVVNGGHP